MIADGIIGYCAPPKNRQRVEPREFLAWAQQDFTSGSKRSRGNALSNIKKALHARLDEIIARTHVQYANNWDDRYVSTDRKLEVIRKLGIKHEAIVALITSIRNDYEHRYLVPNLAIVKAHLSTAELWLEETYRSYEFDRIAFVNLPLYGMGIDYSKNASGRWTQTWFNAPKKKVLYFWDTKKTVVRIHANGEVEHELFKDFSEKEMLKLEAPAIKRRCASESRPVYGQALLTDLYRRYVTWLKREHKAAKGLGLTVAPRK